MKLLITTLLFSLSAIAAETAPSTPAPATPKEACEAIAKAAVENNYKAFGDLTTMHDCGENWDAKSCPMAGKHHKECTDKNCPMHGKAKKKANKKDVAYHHHHHMHGMPSEEGFHKMHEKELSRLKDITCKDEKIAGDRAWVEAVSQNEARLIPFKKKDGQWKFDMHTYHSFYHEREKATEEKK